MFLSLICLEFLWIEEDLHKSAFSPRKKIFSLKYWMKARKSNPADMKFSIPAKRFFNSFHDSFKRVAYCGHNAMHFMKKFHSSIRLMTRILNWNTFGNDCHKDSFKLRMWNFYHLLDRHLRKEIWSYWLLCTWNKYNKINLLLFRVFPSFAHIPHRNEKFNKLINLRLRKKKDFSNICACFKKKRRRSVEKSNNLNHVRAREAFPRVFLLLLIMDWKTEPRQGIEGSIKKR